MGIRYIPEAISAQLVTPEIAEEATREAYLAAAAPDGAIFPVVKGHIGGPENRFSIKSGSTPVVAGFKVGSYRPENARAARPAHSSCILLFDHATGQIDTLIEASVANGYRTAAGNALAVQYLAWPQAAHLAVFGAGHQARFECEAVMRVRHISSVSIVNRDQARAQELAAHLQERVDVSICSAKEACQRADIIVTATASTTSLFEADWVKPGAHISCMGADAVGKQELPNELLHRAELYCDFAPQSLVLGEFQHVRRAAEEGRVTIVNLGEVIAGRASRSQASEVITVFDSSGIALQDLYLAERLLAQADARHEIETLSA
jgi:ornithine cyclodeaminase